MKSQHRRAYLPLIIIAAAMGLLLPGFASVASAAEIAVTLSGEQVVPPVSTSATGTGSITIGDDRSVSGSIQTSGIAGTAAHIHMAAPGQNGPVAVPLTKSADGSTWSVPPGAKLNDAQYAAYQSGNLYVNVHSAAHPGGEIRGQIKR